MSDNADRLRGETTFGYGLAPLPEDLDKEPIPLVTAKTSARNGWPTTKPYHHNRAGLELEQEAARRLMSIRKRVFKIMPAEPSMFTDPITGQRCELVTAPTVGVRHPGCDTLADLCIELDAFYCPNCPHNGRISGAWALEMVRNNADNAVISTDNGDS